MFRVEGWTFDPDEPTRSLQVHAYVDGRYAGRGYRGGAAGRRRRRLPGRGAAHGFRLDLRVPHGKHEICVYAINVGPGDRNPSLGCRSVTAQLSPIGSLDKVAAAGVRTVRVKGWTLDPEVPPSVPGGAGAGRRHGRGHGGRRRGADARRRGAYPRAGSAHGFRADVPIASGGSHKVCAYGVNAAGSGRCGRAARLQVGHPADRCPRLAGQASTPSRRASTTWWAGRWTRAIPPTALQVHVYVDGTYRAAAPAGVSRPDVAARLSRCRPACTATSRVMRLAPGYALGVRLRDPGDGRRDEPAARLPRRCAAERPLRSVREGRRRATGCPRRAVPRPGARRHRPVRRRGGGRAGRPGARRGRVSPGRRGTPTRRPAGSPGRGSPPPAAGPPRADRRLGARVGPAPAGRRPRPRADAARPAAAPAARWS